MVEGVTVEEATVLEHMGKVCMMVKCHWEGCDGTRLGEISRSSFRGTVKFALKCCLEATCVHFCNSSSWSTTRVTTLHLIGFSTCGIFLKKWVFRVFPPCCVNTIGMPLLSDSCPCSFLYLGDSYFCLSFFFCCTASYDVCHDSVVIWHLGCLQFGFLGKD